MTRKQQRRAAALSLLSALFVLPRWTSAEPPADRLTAASQLLIVDSDGWDATRGRLRRLERTSGDSSRGGWQAVGPDFSVWLGRSGMAWRSDDGAPPPPGDGPRKREGDGRSPAGLLELGDLWGYAKGPPGGVRLPYHQSDPRSRCVDDPDSSAYGQLTFAPASGPEPWRSAEHLLMSSDHYKYLVVLDYNVRRSRPGAGSCIFLHVAPAAGGPTAGCTALAEPDLLTVLRWLDPKKRPLLLQLPRSALPKAVKAWGLPSGFDR